MPRADRVSLTAKGLAMPAVDHLSNKGTLNVLLDRTFSGLPAGLPPDRTMVGLFMNFSRLTDKALREYDAARAELLLYVSPPDGLRTSPYLRAIDHMENCVSATCRAVLIEEFARAGVRVEFIKGPRGDSPEDQLMVQFQGMFAEYEKAQLMERYRRGKACRARTGSVNVLSGAPFGYRYLRKSDHAGAAYEITGHEAVLVAEMFRRYGAYRG